MFNLATKAPNFTRENAAEMARRATVSRLAREAREKAEARQLEIEALALAISRETMPDPDDARKAKVLKQIDNMLDDMKDAELKERLAISRTLSDLWKLVQPTAGVMRPRSGNQRRSAPAVSEAPQPVVSCGVKPIPPSAEPSV